MHIVDQLCIHIDIQVKRMCMEIRASP